MNILPTMGKFPISILTSAIKYNDSVYALNSDEYFWYVGQSFTHKGFSIIVVLRSESMYCMYELYVIWMCMYDMIQLNEYKSTYCSMVAVC